MSGVSSIIDYCLFTLDKSCLEISFGNALLTYYSVFWVLTDRALGGVGWGVVRGQFFTCAGSVLCVVSVVFSGFFDFQNLFFFIVSCILCTKV